MTELGERVLRNPITGIDFCCAWAASGQLALASRVMKVRRCMSLSKA